MRQQHVMPVNPSLGPTQVVDDILDITQTTEQLGKTAGKDLASSKTTYPSILGLEQVRLAHATRTYFALLQILG